MADLDDGMVKTIDDGRREVQLVTFEVDGESYGLDVHVVKEINPQVTLTTVPRAPASVRGLANIRGQVVLVLDLAVILGRRRQDASGVVILKTAPELRNACVRGPGFDPAPFGDKPIALLVDQLGDVLSFSSERVLPPPSHVSKTRLRFMKGVIELDDRLLVFLDPCTLLSHDTTP